ncbi:protein of unknown function (plasmid) [Cupriavidus taiwanensis]|uniref:Uncharacterized protein n=1 Tax=Cupriavidus taiwanensis TaxID=164546 RepID=A0A9Q7V002_9BURK|nr:protein of unknown function [Cupriavidus taiwanensis]
MQPVAGASPACEGNLNWPHGSPP